MRKIITHIIYLLFLTVAPAMGQVVEGVVLDTTDSTAIEHVFVRIEGCDGPFALTDKNGHFRLDSISWKNNFRLSFSHVSFKPLHAALQKTNGSYYIEPRNETLKRVDFSLDGNYHPTYQSPLMDTSANRSADIECQYAMLKNKNLQLRLTVNDLFAKDVQSTFYFTDGHYASRQCTIGPIFRLSLKYIFNKGQKVEKACCSSVQSSTA